MRALHPGPASEFALPLSPMPYDPSKPVEGTLCDAAEMRSQLQGLKDEIDAVPVVTAAQVDTTVTLAPGSMATATAQLVGGRSDLIELLEQR